MAEPLRFDEVVEGQALPMLSKHPTTRQLVMYASAEEDYFEGHYDHLYAVAQGQPTVFNHGWLIFAFMCQVVTDCFPQETAVIQMSTARYHKPTYPNDPVLCKGVVKRKYKAAGQRLLEIDLWAEDGAGASTTSGSMLLALLD